MFVWTPIELMLMMCPPLRPSGPAWRMIGSSDRISRTAPK